MKELTDPVVGRWRGDDYPTDLNSIIIKEIRALFVTLLAKTYDDGAARPLVRSTLKNLCSIALPPPTKGMRFRDVAPFLVRETLHNMCIDDLWGSDNFEYFISIFNNLEMTASVTLLVDMAFRLGFTAGCPSKSSDDTIMAMFKGETARQSGRAKGRTASAKKRQAAADERDRAAFYDRWWEKRGKHLQAGINPRTTKNDLINKIVADLEAKGGGRGSGERTVRGAINRWEKNLLAKPTGKIAGREITPECDHGGA